jgi:voltage-gated hydrogen channel 1
LVVVAGFVVDVLLHGIIEEAASLIVIMRLWRVFKIIEELSVGAQEQTEDLQHKIEELENDNKLLRKENSHLRRTLNKAGVQDDGHNTPPTPD